MLKYLLLFALLFGAIYLPSEFSRHSKRRLSECEGFYSLASHMRDEIGCFLSATEVWCSVFSNSALEEVGFLAARREHKDLAVAFISSKDKTALSESERDAVLRFCTSFGKGYADTQIRLIDSFCKSLGEHIDAERERLPRSQRLVRTLSASVALALAILII